MIDFVLPVYSDIYANGIRYGHEGTIMMMLGP